MSAATRREKAQQQRYDTYTDRGIVDAFERAMIYEAALVEIYANLPGGLTVEEVKEIIAAALEEAGAL